MNKYEESRNNLEKLLNYYSSNHSYRNEATTRFHLIDNLLLNCLAWESNDFINELRYNDEYADYTIVLNRPVAIIEAKREGNYFELPHGYKGNITYSLKSLCKDDNNVASALKQVSQYCQERGIQIGIVTNGWQIIIFVANRTDSIPPLEGKAIIFDSLQTMLDNFKTLWNALSKPGFSGNFILKTLLGEDLPDLPLKLSGTILNYPGIKDRNPFQIDLQIISEIVLDDIIKDKDIEKKFLRECYCKSGALSQYALVSKEILMTRYEYLFEKDDKKVNIQNAIDKKGLIGDFADIFANSLKRRPILLVGDVGVGKTTFINHLIQIDADNLFAKALTFVVDLGSKITMSLDVRIAIIDEIIQQLDEFHNIDIYDNNFVRGVYNKELLKLRYGIYKSYFESNNSKGLEKEIEFLENEIKDKPKYLSNVLAHISKGREKQIIIFVDNCDQRDDNTQQQAFLIAQEIAEHWNVTIFLTLRPETFHKSIKTGALSGYHPKAFTISPPRISDVIEKRLNFAQKITKGQIPIKSLNLSLTFENLDILLEILKYSMQYNDNLNECIENISNGNVRQAINLVKAFLASGHVNTKKFIDIYRESGKYTIPIHEFLRAIIFGDNIHFSPQNSSLVNLFDITFGDKKEHFILPILLSILHFQMNTRKDNGFCHSEILYQQLQGLGFIPNQIDNVLIISYKKKLIESSEKGSVINKGKFPLMFRITSLGVYHINKLISLFTYIDSIIVDTPVLDDSIRTQIKDVFQIQDRILRANSFIKYLDESWFPFNNKSTYFDWNIISNSLKTQIEDIKIKIEKSQEYNDNND